jgi:hypothetical protein
MDDAGKLSVRHPLEQHDYNELDDPEFLAMCRRVRTLREDTPRDEVSSELAAEYEAVNREFMRRAGLAWQRVS